MRKVPIALLVLLASWAASTAKADLLFTGSQAGLCCFDVNLHDLTGVGVQVTVSLTEGALWFIDSGSGQHPGFAFNLSGDPAITVSQISSPWGSTDFHSSSVTTGGPSLGSFDYYFDNPGPGGSTHNPGPLSFVVNGSGITENSFVTNSSGYYFVADIMDANRNTGLSGIGVPEGASLPTVLAFGLGLLWLRRKRQAAKS